tara:strand:- start:373 stop:582 length:210 start_codon:yes stop_codon:yes gene_type:complete
MLEIMLRKNNESISIKDDGESMEDAIELAQKVIGWAFQEIIELQIVQEKDDAIYIETNQPKDHVEHEGM